MGINARGNIDTTYASVDLPEGGQALAGTSEKDETGKQTGVSHLRKKC